jgi:hypothetical protein
MNYQNLRLLAKGALGIGVFLLGMYSLFSFLSSSNPSEVLAQGNGNCLANYNEKDEDSPFAITAPSGKVIIGLTIKSGDNCFGPYTFSGTYENSKDGPQGALVPNSCYQIVGIGTQSVSVNKVGPGHAQVCQDISHIEVKWEDSVDPSVSPSPTVEITPTLTPTPTPPDFPQCPLDYDGDPHYPRGGNHEHQIVNGPRLLGGDDVYSLENGNYLQCFCPDEGTGGIQTNWWRTDLILDGWFREFGTQWNLGDFWYLAQNTEFTCENGGGNGGNGDTSPTPTPTNIPSNNSNNDNSSSSDSSSGGIGGASDPGVLGATTLANTGSVSDLYIMLGLILSGVSAYGLKSTSFKGKKA